MRIITGKLGGRSFQSPKGRRTHPMSERVRGALFNMLGDIEGLSVLDPFAGSGALSLEALSRGAAEAVAIDIDKAAHRIIQENAAALGLADRLKAIRANASSWSDHNPDRQFDIILGDPPYDSPSPRLLQKLARHVRPGGTLVLSLPPKAAVELPADCRLLVVKSFGDAEIRAYRKTL